MSLTHHTLALGLGTRSKSTGELCDLAISRPYLQGVLSDEESGGAKRQVFMKHGGGEERKRERTKSRETHLVARLSIYRLTECRSLTGRRCVYVYYE